VVAEAVGEIAMALDVLCQRQHTSETSNATTVLFDTLLKKAGN